MKRRGFISMLMGAIAGVPLVKVLPAAAAPMPLPAPTVTGRPRSWQPNCIDVRAALTAAMLQEIQEEEDRAFIDAVRRMRA